MLWLQEGPLRSPLHHTLLHSKSRFSPIKLPEFEASAVNELCLSEHADCQLASLPACLSPTKYKLDQKKTQKNRGRSAISRWRPCATRRTSQAIFQGCQFPPAASVSTYSSIPSWSERMLRIGSRLGPQHAQMRKHRTCTVHPICDQVDAGVLCSLRICAFGTRLLERELGNV